jgi:type II secretory pathway component PulF
MDSDKQNVQNIIMRVMSSFVLLMIAYVLLMIVPKFKMMFVEMGIALPVFTRWLFGVAEFFSTYSIIFIPWCILVIVILNIVYHFLRVSGKVKAIRRLFFSVLFAEAIFLTWAAVSLCLPALNMPE